MARQDWCTWEILVKGKKEGEDCVSAPSLPSPCPLTDPTQCVNPNPPLPTCSLLAFLWCDQEGCIRCACSDSLTQVCFEQPAVPTSILVFLASDGTAPSDQHKPRVTVQLSDVDGLNRSLGEHWVQCPSFPNCALSFAETRGQAGVVVEHRNETQCYQR